MSKYTTVNVKKAICQHSGISDSDADTMQKVFDFMADGLTPSEIDRKLLVPAGTSKELTIRYWAADKQHSKKRIKLHAKTNEEVAI